MPDTTDFDARMRKIHCSNGDNPLLKCEASGGSQAWSVEECFAFDHAAARTPKGAFLNAKKSIVQITSGNEH